MNEINEQYKEIERLEKEIKRLEIHGFYHDKMKRLMEESIYTAIYHLKNDNNTDAQDILELSIMNTYRLINEYIEKISELLNEQRSK